tara:strand:- start:42 stop:1190 length:1149 start_codon:yes stop_codon:yes gene_type:complete
METHLKSTYGFNDFRDYQKDIVCDLLNKENVFAILPTGGGKSLLYQFPATYTNNITIVVSPLISLMNDQCMFLNSKNIKSVCLNSESRADVSTLSECKIIYTTPEFITNRILVIDKLKEHIGLFAIDEAHCVSQWSHDFRTSYLELAVIKKTFPKIPMLAVTATATPRVVDDMYELLGIEEASEYNLGSRRTNLEINIHPKRLFDNCKFTEPTIIYVQTRKVCEKLCEKLLITGTRCCQYHGGMEPEEKKKSHDLFFKSTVISLLTRAVIGIISDNSFSVLPTHMTKFTPVLRRFNMFFVIRISRSSFIYILERDLNNGFFFIKSIVLTIPNVKPFTFMCVLIILTIVFVSSLISATFCFLIPLQLSHILHLGIWPTFSSVG